MKKTFLILSSVLALGVCGACGAQENTKKDACYVEDINNICNCHEGEVMWFKPNGWGNEQIPLQVIFSSCDMSKPVFFNISSVVCTYKPRNLDDVTLADKIAEEKKPATEAKPAEAAKPAAK